MRTMNGWWALAALAVASCGNNTKPVEPPRVAEEDAAVPVVDAAPPEPVVATVDSAPPPQRMALCSVGGDPIANKQCIVWTGCGGGMLQTLGGRPIRKCAPKAGQCEDVEAKLVAASQRLTQGKRTCKTKFYLGKEVVIGEATFSVCPEDPDDKELSTIWKQVGSTCREPYRGEPDAG